MCDGPKVTTATVSKDELLAMHKDMFIIRRMEITSDTEYKVRGRAVLTASATLLAFRSSPLLRLPLPLVPLPVQERRIRGFCHLYDGQVRPVSPLARPSPVPQSYHISPRTHGHWRACSACTWAVCPHANANYLLVPPQQCLRCRSSL